MRLKPLLAFLFLSLFTELGSAYSPEVSVRGSQIQMTGNGGLSLSLQVCSPTVVRVLSEDIKNKEIVCEAKTNLQVTVYEDYLNIFTGALNVRLYKKPTPRVDFYDKENKVLISGEIASHDQALLPIHTRRLEPEDKVVGLGQDNDAYLGRLDRQGGKRDLWTGQQIRHGHVTADIPIPFFIKSNPRSPHTYGIFFDNPYRTEIDLGNRDKVTWKALGGPIDYYFIYGPRLPDVVERYTALVGRQPLPPRWVLGFIQSKCTYKTWDEMEAVSSTLKSKSIPLDAMVIDYDWAEDLNNFKWHPRWGGMSSEKIRQFKADGVNLMISNSGPMIRKDSSNFLSGLEADIFARDDKGETMTCGHYRGELMDFTTPKMKPWLWPQIKHLHEDGITAWWLDLTEPEDEPSTARYYAGPSAKVHNSYSQVVSRVFSEMQREFAPTERNFILTRTGTPGIQKLGAAIWTGDIYSDYETLQAHVPEALNAQLSGISLWTADSGGFLEGLYKGSLEKHGDLYARWLEFSAFSPITRVHHVGPSAPYMFGEKVEAISRKYIQLRYELFPYIYSYLRKAHETGAPLMRPLAWDFEKDQAAWLRQDEYLFGHELLVAPVLTEDTSKREVYLPEGEWVDLETDDLFLGGRNLTVDSPLEKIPLFVKRGSIIPKMPLVMNLTTAKIDVLFFHVYPTADGRAGPFTVYLDDGHSTQYESGDYTKLEATMEDWKFSVKESNTKYAPSRYEVIIHAKDKRLVGR